MTSTYSNTNMWLSGAPMDTDDYPFVNSYESTSPVPPIVAVRPSAVFHRGQVSLCASTSDEAQMAAYLTELRKQFHAWNAAKDQQTHALHTIASECAANASVTFYRCSCCGERTLTQVDDGIRRCVICVSMVELHEPEWGGEEVDPLCCCNGCARGWRCETEQEDYDDYDADDEEYVPDVIRNLFRLREEDYGDDELCTCDECYGASLERYNNDYDW